MEPATGRCLCGAVRFELSGPLRDVTLCHCVECRRWHGAAAPMTSVPNAGLSFVSDAALRWIDSPDSDAHARRGFCGECGSSLFWDAPDRDSVSISAGALDPPTGLRTVEQIYTHQASDFYELDPRL